MKKLTLEEPGYARRRERFDRAADEMFPNLPPEARSLAYALIDAGLCFHTCEPDCRGRCVQEAERAVRSIGLG